MKMTCSSHSCGDGGPATADEVKRANVVWSTPGAGQKNASNGQPSNRKHRYLAG